MIVRCEIKIDVIRRKERHTEKEDFKEIMIWNSNDLLGQIHSTQLIRI